MGGLERGDGGGDDQGGGRGQNQQHQHRQITEENRELAQVSASEWNPVHAATSFYPIDKSALNLIFFRIQRLHIL